MSRSNEKNAMGDRPDFLNSNSLSRDEKIARLIDIQRELELRKVLFAEYDRLSQEIVSEGIGSAKLHGETDVLLQQAVDISFRIDALEDMYEMRNQLVTDLAKSGFTKGNLGSEPVEIVDNFASGQAGKFTIINRYSLKVGSIEDAKREAKNAKNRATRAKNKAGGSV